MLTVNIHEAKTRLSELIARAVAGEPFVIAKAGKPMVKVEAFSKLEPRKPQRIGFAKGLWPEMSDEQWQAWKDLDREIERDFEESPPLDWGGEPARDRAA